MGGDTQRPCTSAFASRGHTHIHGVDAGLGRVLSSLRQQDLSRAPFQAISIRYEPPPPPSHSRSKCILYALGWAG